MSKGTKITPVRLPQQLLDLTSATIICRGVGKSGKVWTVSDFIRHAVAEKIAKMNRSRGRKITSPADERVKAYLRDCKENEEAILTVSDDAIGTDKLPHDRETDWVRLDEEGDEEFKNHMK